MKKHLISQKPNIEDFNCYPKPKMQPLCKQNKNVTFTNKNKILLILIFKKLDNYKEKNILNEQFIFQILNINDFLILFVTVPNIFFCIKKKNILMAKI